MILDGEAKLVQYHKKRSNKRLEVTLQRKAGTSEKPLTERAESPEQNSILKTTKSQDFSSPEISPREMNGPQQKIEENMKSINSSLKEIHSQVLQLKGVKYIF